MTDRLGEIEARLAALIENAPADIRYLLDEVKRLQSLQSDVTCCYCGWCTWQDEETEKRIAEHRLHCAGYQDEVKQSQADRDMWWGKREQADNWKRELTKLADRLTAENERLRKQLEAQP